MGINYITTINGRRLEVNVAGGLSLKLAEAYFDSLVKDTSVHKDAVEIVRFINGFKFHGDFSDCEAIAKSYQKPKYKKDVLATVFVCGTSYAYGIARMLHTAFEMYLPEHPVFIARSEKELSSLIARLMADAKAGQDSSGQEPSGALGRKKEAAAG